MVTAEEIKRLNQLVDIGALLTFLGVPPMDIKVKNKARRDDYRCPNFWRNGDNPFGMGITFNYQKQKWLCSDFTHKTFGNIDLIDFLTKYCGKRFGEAIELLAFSSGKGMDGSVDTDSIEGKTFYASKPMTPVAIDPNILQSFEQGLHQYWAGRGYDAKVAKLFQLGYCSYGTLKDRLTIPILDENKRLVAVQGRVTNDYITPKYLYMDSVQGESAKLTLYNYWLAKTYAKSRGWVGVVESANTVWRAYQYEYMNFVATLSTSVTDRQLQLLAELGVNVVIFADNDHNESAAGQIGSLKLAERLKEKKIPTWIAIPPVENSDPADLIKDTFTLSLKGAKQYC